MNALPITSQKPAFPRSACPISNALDIIGDKWTLLIIRDLFLGKHLYRQMMQSPEGIASNILANRLQRLEQAQFITKRAYQFKPIRYEYHLTPKGQDLQAVLQAMAKWGLEHVPGTRVFTDMNSDGLNMPK